MGSLPIALHINLCSIIIFKLIPVTVAQTLNRYFWGIHKHLRQQHIHLYWSRLQYYLIYRIAGFSHEDFNLAVWAIRNIKIRNIFHHALVLFVRCNAFSTCKTVVVELKQVLVCTHNSLFLCLISSLLPYTTRVSSL